MRYIVRDPKGEDLDYILFKVYGNNWSRHWRKAYQDNPSLLEIDGKVSCGTELMLEDTDDKYDVVDVWN